MTKEHHVRNVSLNGATEAELAAEVEARDSGRSGCADKGVQCDLLGVSEALDTRTLTSFASVCVL